MGCFRCWCCRPKKDSGDSDELSSSESSSEDSSEEIDPQADPGWDSLIFGNGRMLEKSYIAAWLPAPVHAMTGMRTLEVVPLERDGVVVADRNVGDWWAEGDCACAPGFEGLTPVSRLLNVRVVQHLGEELWLAGKSDELYHQMGAFGPGGTYVAVWLNMGDRSICLFSEITNIGRFETCVQGDFLADRVKLILNPVSTKLPFPSKGPKDADTVRSFFGQSASSTRGRIAFGAEVVCIQIDLHASRILKWGLQKVGFKPGNTVELFLVDWPGRNVLSGARLAVTASLDSLLQ